MEAVSPTSLIREKVSKKKIRYRKDGFDLDLTYITDRIVALGFPSVGTEAMFRNPLAEVFRFFEYYHKDKYKMYNLCAERKYDETKFHSRVAQYPFYDHNAPPLGLVAECCEDIHQWLSADPENVVGINCKAGKGRTGLIICCFLLYSKTCVSTDEALDFYGKKRTKNGKGVTIASQQRYIRYYEEVLNSTGKVPKTPAYKLLKLEISSPPKGATHQYVTVEIDNQSVLKTEMSTVKKSEPYELPVAGIIRGDCKIQIWAKPSLGSEYRLCHFWLNTGFIPSDGRMTLVKETIDIANKDKTCKTFKANFTINAIFEGPLSSGESEEEHKEEKKKDKSENEEKDGNNSKDERLEGKKRGAKAKRNKTTSLSNSKKSSRAEKSEAKADPPSFYPETESTTESEEIVG